ncbi:MAG: nitric oxide reductase activation protein NorD [Paracoccaceae bacterium]
MRSGSDLHALLPPDLAALAEELPPGLHPALCAALPDARRRLSPRGLDTWLRGVGALHRLGRGEALVLEWIGAAPQIARDLGEDVVAEFATACAGFASRTSGAVIERIIATAPLAARRLGDAQLFRSWLRFLEHLLGRAPRAMRPMLDQLGTLLDVLTLGGLRRWADWGADAHRTDYQELERYFSLASEESRAILRRERKGTLFVDVQRRLGLYLRALWGRDFLIAPTAGDFETRAGLQPYAEGHTLYLADSLDDWQGIAALDLYRAQLAHLAAHMAALKTAFQGDGLNALQMTCIGLIEDARAEALAIARFPRLADLWLSFHGETAAGVAGQFDRIARALLAGEADDPLSGWVLDRFRTMDLTDAGATRALGLGVADRLRMTAFSAWRDRPSCPYRCDNRILWEYEELEVDSLAAGPAQLRKYVSVTEMVNEVEVEFAGADAQEIWVQAHELLDDDGGSFNESLGKEPVAPPVFYDEFDHTIQMMRPAWVTVLERRGPPGDPGLADAILADHAQVMNRLRHRLAAMRPQGMQRIRKLEDGDDLDVDAAVSAAVDTRLRRQPDMRVMLRRVLNQRDTAVLLLLDLSESTNDPVAGGQSILDIARTAALLMSEATHKVGDSFAVHGFCSDGRAQVYYDRFKDFDQPWGPAAKARIMGAQGRLSTRMGAALRHATQQLRQLRATRRLLLVLTDGAPADIDVRDPLYLRADARRAVEEAQRDGITPFCLTLDPGADAYAQRIFGARNVQVVDRVERLPERLPALYAAIAR